MCSTDLCTLGTGKWPPKQAESCRPSGSADPPRDTENTAGSHQKRQCVEERMSPALSDGHSSGPEEGLGFSVSTCGSEQSALKCVCVIVCVFASVFLM